MLKLVVFCVVGVVWLQLPSEGGAECCWGSMIVKDHGMSDTKCSDCTKANPYCGTPIEGLPSPDDCNIFGCDCSACRVGTCFRSSARTANPQVVIHDADTNKNGKVDLLEAWYYLEGNGINTTNLAAYLHKLDKDKNMYLSVKEIDPKYQW